MSVDGFIPNVWSAKVQTPLRKAQVFGQPLVINHDYEGDIQQIGDAVRIGMVGDVTLSSYTKNSDITAAETLQDAQATLTIDTGKVFHFYVDDVDKRQSQANFSNAAMQSAAFKLSDAQDTAIAALYTDAGSTVGSSGAPKTDLGTATQAYVWLVALAQALDEANVPTEGRWCAVPPWYYAKLLLDDRFVKSGAASGAVTLANGQVGEAAGFTILKSNNVSNDGTTWRIMAGTNQAITFAQQIAEVVAYRPEKRFGDAIKGLSLWGVKCLRPEYLACLYANKA